MSSANDPPQGSWTPGDGFDGPSSFPTPMSAGITPRQPLSRRESRNTGNWPDASPIHHNEGTSYFQPRSISPTVSRRLAAPPSTPGPSSYQRPGSSASGRDFRQHRSTSVSSMHQSRRDTRDTFSEEDEDDDEDEDEVEPHIRRRGKRTPAPQPEGDPSGSDDPEGEAARAEAASDAGSLDPVTLCVQATFCVILTFTDAI